MKNPINAVFYLRKRQSLSQTELAKKLRMTANDISRIEKGNLGTSIGKFDRLAKHFSVSVDALVRNDFDQIIPTLTETVTTTRKLQERIRRRQEICDRIGEIGEDWVREQEIKKLAGTVFANAVNQNYADDEEVHCDLICPDFDKDGKLEFVCIEVKSTTGGADEPFYITAKELDMARYCQAKGIRYEIHRVYHVLNKKKIGRIIYSADDLLTKFDLVPDNYVVRKKVC